MTKINAPNLFYSRTRMYSQEENTALEMNYLFKEAVAKTCLNVDLDIEKLLILNSLYNQATKGDFDLEHANKITATVSKAEFDAWACLKGKSVQDAQKEYIFLVHELKI